VDRPTAYLGSLDFSYPAASLQHARSAQTIAVCGDRSAFDTIVDQFLRRKAEPSMIYAVEKTGTSDELVV
jgi:hypothetical protein